MSFLGLFPICTCRKFIDDIDLPIGDFSGAHLEISEEDYANFERYYFEVTLKLGSEEGQTFAHSAYKAFEAARNGDWKLYSYYSRLHEETLTVLPEEEQWIVSEYLGTSPDQLQCK
ncbi:MAG TPA: hypothetical protein VLE27_08520 [Thermoanaerobaculia bacterium]|nr:hypothetical protein [Thermoanaerobaculia bacterium]